MTWCPVAPTQEARHAQGYLLQLPVFEGVQEARGTAFLRDLCVSESLGLVPGLQPDLSVTLLCLSSYAAILGRDETSQIWVTAWPVLKLQCCNVRWYRVHFKGRIHFDSFISDFSLYTVISVGRIHDDFSALLCVKICMLYSRDSKLNLALHLSS